MSDGSKHQQTLILIKYLGPGGCKSGHASGTSKKSHEETGKRESSKDMQDHETGKRTSSRDVHNDKRNEKRRSFRQACKIVK